MVAVAGEAPLQAILFLLHISGHVAARPRKSFRKSVFCWCFSVWLVFVKVITEQIFYINIPHLRSVVIRERNAIKHFWSRQKIQVMSDYKCYHINGRSKQRSITEK